ncbi:Octaprenyl diphosphate synthase [Labilithrix luteola]|uniref:Octaprenyl diphosphate synthase n=1 Tax=Labilithrix luteola TaxID=1391654 RepID=A0A0K1QB17_9BACT|nr:polyprenyl synthetase family protein [Labilithrix luteola]AKV02934.1 Octaprenyl diphosphate synthase [Labilithrix luteola]
MTFPASLHALHDTAVPDRVGDRTSARLADVRSLIARELEEVEAIIAKHIAAGVAPATESANHLFEAGGKRIRPMALLLATECFRPIDTRARELAAAAEIVHMATLLHDDVVDDSDQRRGRPTSRRVWGNAVSVLAGDLLLVEALRLGSRAHPETWSELINTLGRLVDGEVIQLRGRLAVSLDEDTYFQIVRGKTASLFEWALRAGAREGGASASAIDALGAFGGHLGVAFQLVDDVLDYEGDEGTTGKTMLADLHEGKVTLPLLRAAAASPDVAPLVASVRAGDAAAASTLAAKVRASGACDQVRDLARHETASALHKLEAVPSCRARDVLADVARGLTARLA